MQKMRNSNRLKTQDRFCVFFNSMKIFHQQDILQMHLHISFHDNPIGLALVSFTVINSIRPKPLYIPQT